LNKRVFAAGLLLVLLCAFFPGNAAASTADAGSGEALAPTYEAFMDKDIAVLTGTIYDAMSKELIHARETLYYEDISSMYESVRNGRADAALLGYFTAYLSLFEDVNADLGMVEIPIELSDNPIAAISGEQMVVDEFNEFLAEIKADGTYDEMVDRWLRSFDPQNVPAMPDIPSGGKNETLVVATSMGAVPFTFLGENGTMLGFDIEMARRFAAFCGKDVELVDMAFSGVLPYVVSGKADIALAEITVTEERAQQVLFTQPYFSEPHALVYDNSSAGSATPFNLITWLKDGIQNNLIEGNRWMLIVQGIRTTLIISVLAQLLGTLIGCLLCWVLLRNSRFVRGLGGVYSGVINGLPMVVLLLISYYIIFGETDISHTLIAVCAFALVKAADVASNLKGSIDTVDKTEIEAARSIGFSAFGAFTTVTLPQAIKRALPGYCSGFVDLVKATAIVGYIAIQDLTRAADIIRSSTFDADFPLLFVALIYLLATTILVQLFKLLVRMIGTEARK
jgi:polar amino acid transport system substrate-binding protein